MTYPTKPQLFYDCADCGETNFDDVPYVADADGNMLRLAIPQLTCTCGWRWPE